MSGAIPTLPSSETAVFCDSEGEGLMRSSPGPDEQARERKDIVSVDGISK